MLTLALGIAANTTVFSWIDAILLHPLRGVAKLDHLVVVEPFMPTGEFNSASIVEYRHFRNSLQLTRELASAHFDTFSFGEPEAGQRVWGELVSDNYFAVLAVRATQGRVFRPGEYGTSPAVQPVAVISERLWRSRFNSEPAIIGSTIRLNRRDLTIIGVVPSAFRGLTNGLSCDLWVPLTNAAELRVMNDNAFKYRGSRGWNLVGKLQAGATIEQAQAEATSAARVLDAESPDTAKGVGAIVSPVAYAHYGAAAGLREPLRILMAVSVLVLLIACANVANLLLARSLARQKEFGVRLALGARGWRLARQHVAEALLLTAGGTAIGLFATVWMQDALGWLVPSTGLPIYAGVELNGHVMAFTILLCIVAAIISSAVPAMASLTASVSESLRKGGRNAAGARSHRAHGLLVIAEVALAAVALISAGLFVRSFRNATNLQPGFDPRNVLLARFYFSSAAYSEQQVLDSSRRLRERLASIPGIVAVSYADSMPLGLEGTPFNDITVEGYTPAAGEYMKVHRTLVAPGYFDLLRIPLLEGRDFTARDGRSSPLVMIVNDTFARRFFAGANPIGRRVLVERRTFTIVGVAKTSKYGEMTERPQSFFYLPFEQVYSTGLGTGFLIRTTGEPTEAVDTIRAVVNEIDPAVRAFHAVRLSEYTSVSLYTHKTAAALLSVLGVLSLVLAAVGLYSVIAYTVGRRTQELGIRVALGAGRTDIAGMVLRHGLTLTALGLAAGLTLALAAARIIGSTLVNLSPADPATFAATAAFLLVLAVLASYLPAHRAMKVDPMTALRSE